MRELRKTKTAIQILPIPQRLILLRIILPNGHPVNFPILCNGLGSQENMFRFHRNKSKLQPTFHCFTKNNGAINSFTKAQFLNYKNTFINSHNFFHKTKSNFQFKEQSFLQFSQVNA